MSVGYVYVLAFDNGTVKVGRTQNTGQRLNTHKSDAGKFGVALVDHWVSPPHVEWMRNEDALKVIATELGGTVRRKEYFSGVAFAAVAAAAEELTFTPPAQGAARPLPVLGREQVPLQKPVETREESLVKIGRVFLEVTTEERIAEVAAYDPLMAEMATATAHNMIRSASLLLGVTSPKEP